MSIVGVTASSRRQVPNAPTIGTATDVGTSRAYNNGAATVTFTPSPVGFEAASFTVTSNPGGYTATGASSPLTVTGLQSNVAYTFTVTATNFVGTGSASAASNSITATTVPQAPTIGTPTLANGQAYTGSANIGVAFTAGATGGKAITTFTATSSSTAFVSGASSPISVSDTVGTARTYTVTASNANGTSLASSASASITPSSVPQAPTITSVTNVAGQPVNAPQASVAFTAGATGGSAITLFTVTSSSGAINTGASSPVVITESGAGTYTYTVVATNARGNSLASTGVAASVSSVPSAPTIGTATNVTNIAYGSNPNITISFTANSAGGSPISSYKYSTNGGTTYATATGTTSPLTLTLQSTGVAFVAGSTYSVILKAVNSSGDSTASAASNSVVASTKPQAPTVGTPTSASGQPYGPTASVSIPFTAGATGGSAITTFTVLSSSGATTTSATSPFTLFETPGSSYTYTVTATNVNGVSAASATSASVLVTTAPQAFAIGTLSNVTEIPFGSNPQFTLTFTPPPPGPPSMAVTDYEYSTNGGVTFAQLLNSSGGTAITSPVTLTVASTGIRTGSYAGDPFVAGTSYSVILRANNASGGSSPTSPSNSVIAATKPSAPTISLVNTASNIITVNYSYNTGGLNTTSSTSTLSPTIAATVGGTSSGAASGSYTLTASYLQGTAYSVTYAVTNAMGTSPNSNTPSTTPFAATVPGAPASLSAAVASSTSVTLTYGAISQNGSALTAWTGSGTSTGDIVSSPAVNLTYSGTPSTAGGSVTVTGTFAAATSYTFSLRARNSVGAGTTATSGSVTPLPVITDNFNRTTSGTLGTSSSGVAWSPTRGTWFANGSQGVSNDAGSGYPLASVAYGNANAVVSSSVSSGTGVAFWVTDSGSWWAAVSYNTETSYSAQANVGTITYADATCSVTSTTYSANPTSRPSTTTYSCSSGTLMDCTGQGGIFGKCCAVSSTSATSIKTCNETYGTGVVNSSQPCTSCNDTVNGVYQFIGCCETGTSGAYRGCKGLNYTTTTSYSAATATVTYDACPAGKSPCQGDSINCCDPVYTYSCVCNSGGSPTNPSGPTSACQTSYIYYTCPSGGTLSGSSCYSQFYNLRVISSVAGTVTNPVVSSSLSSQPQAIKVTTSGNSYTAQAYTDIAMSTALGSPATGTNTGTKGPSHGIVKAVSPYNQGSTVDNFSASS